MAAVFVPGTSMKKNSKIQAFFPLETWQTSLGLRASRAGVAKFYKVCLEAQAFQV